jgi:chromate transport protein ChrA
VADTGWLTPAQFATGVGLSYATPGPVLILAVFIGYYAAAVPGAVAATVAAFTVPVLLAGFAAQLVAKLKDVSWFRAFGRFAVAAVVGLLGVTRLALARPRDRRSASSWGSASQMTGASGASRQKLSTNSRRKSGTRPAGHGGSAYSS